jgi:hypothetical protein
MRRMPRSCAPVIVLHITYGLSARARRIQRGCGENYPANRSINGSPCHLIHRGRLTITVVAIGSTHRIFGSALISDFAVEGVPDRLEKVKELVERTSELAGRICWKCEQRVRLMLRASPSGSQPELRPFYGVAPMFQSHSHQRGWHNKLRRAVIGFGLAKAARYKASLAFDS